LIDADLMVMPIDNVPYGGSRSLQLQHRFVRHLCERLQNIGKERLARCSVI